MHLPKERIYYLLEMYTSKKATVQEEQELMEWLHEAGENSELKDYIEEIWNQHRQTAGPSHVDWDNMFNQAINSDKVYELSPGTRNQFIWWKRLAVAAAVLTFMISGYFLFWNKEDQAPLPVVKNEVEHKVNDVEVPVKDVAAPVTNKATLRLSNGKVIILDNAGMGSLAAHGVANASRLNDGLLAYTGSEPTAVEYHTLQVPKGSKPMRLLLADGSEVWLNAESSITFPNVFAGNERMVSVTGETYFEVNHDATRPFIVSKGEMQVRVLGTKFNVNAYEDEDDLRITLLEGSVVVANGNKEDKLEPGQQARVKDEKIEVRDDIDLNEVMAWKNGLFEFNQTDIQTIMRQIERWYDVEVVFEKPVTQHFNGTIQRQVNVSKVLNMLEKTSGIRFSIEGNKVIVRR